MSKLIVLDPGHGGRDPGAVGFGLTEKESALDLAQKIRSALLDRYDVRVELTRTEDVTVPLADRVAFANRLRADFFFSVHHNAFDGRARGFESYIYRGAVPPFTEVAQRWIHAEIMRALKPYGVADRGTKRADFAVLRLTAMPALLVEFLFIDNAEDNALLRNPAARTAMAEATAKGLARMLDLAPRSSPPAPLLPSVTAGPPTSDATAGKPLKTPGASPVGTPLYRVQVGAFSDRSSAEALLRRLKTLGFHDAWIVGPTER